MKAKLTLTTAKKLTPIQCVKYYNPKIHDEEANYIVWNETCYPFSASEFLKQLYDLYKKGKLSIQRKTKAPKKNAA